MYEPLVEKGYNFGFIRFTHEALVAHPEQLQKIYARIIPVAIDYNPISQHYLIKAFSIFFKPLVAGDLIPTYTVRFFDEIDCVKFEQVEHYDIDMV